jgi:hypothetical protein
VHTRKVFTIVNLFSLIGGVSNFLIDLFGVIFFPMTRFIVYLKSISKIYFVHSTQKRKLFKEGFLYEAKIFDRKSSKKQAKYLAKKTFIEEAI